jgi:hypothetical protein
MEVIKKLFPKATNPKAYFRSNWSKDKYSQQSYTFIPTGASPKDIEVIA